MPPTSSLAPRSGKGLLTPDNCVLALIDVQPQMLFGVCSADRQGVINCNLVLAGLWTETCVALPDGYRAHALRRLWGRGRVRVFDVHKAPQTVYPSYRPDKLL